MSPSGALIEGTNLPPVGTEIILRRGQLEASGAVAWTASGRLGLSFNFPVTVSNWLPSNKPSRQRSIDRFVFELKHTNRAPDVTEDHANKDAKQSLPAVVAGLEFLKVELGQLADKLSLDVILVATHPEVQFLDEAVQRIGKIIQVIQMADGFAQPIPA